MTKREKEHYLNKKLIGYWSACNGLEVKEIICGINDYVIVVSNAWSSQRKVHKLQVHSTSKGQYINVYGNRFYLNECIKEWQS